MKLWGGIDTDKVMEESSNHLRNNNYHEALTGFEKILQVNPRNSRALYGKARALAGLDRKEEALEFYDKTLELDPKNVHAWTEKGLMISGLTKPGEYDVTSLLKRAKEILACLDEALSIDPNYLNALFSKAHVFFAMGRSEDGIRYAEEALSRHPSDRNLLHGVSQMYAAVRKYDQALACIDKALSLDQKDAEAWRIKAELLLKLDRDSEAKKCLKTHVELTVEKTRIGQNASAEELSLIPVQCARCEQIVITSLDEDEKLSEKKCLVCGRIGYLHQLQDGG